MRGLSETLLCLVDSAEPKLRAIGDEQSVKPALPGGWSCKEVLGHLIDSASNNHQRFVRALIQDSLEFPEYQQEESSRVQNPRAAEWGLLVTLWAAYNRYLAHVIAMIPESKLNTPCRIGDGEELTLASLAKGYISHLVHHLEQIGATKPRQTTLNL